MCAPTGVGVAFRYDASSVLDGFIGLGSLNHVHVVDLRDEKLVARFYELSQRLARCRESATSAARALAALDKSILL